MLINKWIKKISEIIQRTCLHNDKKEGKVMLQVRLYFSHFQTQLVTSSTSKYGWFIGLCTTPSKLVVYQAPGDERALDHNDAQQWCQNKFALHIMWICAILSRTKIRPNFFFFLEGGYFSHPIDLICNKMNRLLHCSLWWFSGALFFFGGEIARSPV